MKTTLIYLLFFLIFQSTLSAQTMKIDNLNGPVTETEIASFKNYVSTQSKSSDNIGNAFVYGTTGATAEALGMMYEISNDIEILNMMINYADHMLQARNNPTTGRIVWTGKRELCWPNKDIAALDAAYTGTENGDVIAHIVYCAKLIIQNQNIWNIVVPAGDPYNFGSTYIQRARKYISECNATLDSFIIPHFVKPVTYGLIFPESALYGIDARTTTNIGRPVPWNQQTMLAGGFQRIAECLELLNEDPARVTLYKNIVGAFISSFQQSLLLYQKDGHDCYKWSYSASDPTYKYVEDAGHASYDLLGLMRAYESNSYNVTPQTLQIFANSVRYAMYQTDGTFSERVDGTLNVYVGYLSTGFIILSAVSPEMYGIVANAAMSRLPTKADIMASVLWAKYKFYGILAKAPSTLTALAGTNTQINLSWIDNSVNETSFVIERSLDGSSWNNLTSTAANKTSYSDTSINESTLYFYRIKAVDSNGSSAYSNTSSATTTLWSLRNIALKKTATASNIYSTSYPASNAVDGSYTTRWATKPGTTTATLDVDLGGTHTFSQVVLRENAARVATYKIQYWNGTSWLDAYSGTTIGTTDKTVNFTAVTGTKVRLNILTCSAGGPTIWEFVVNGYNSIISKINSNIELVTSNQLDAYPNPVANNLTISYSLSNSGLTTIDMYTISGIKIKSIVNENAVTGNYKAEVNVNDIPNGFYIVRLINKNNIKCVKISVER